MANEVTLNFTAEQIDVRLENAGNAILHTEQTLTPEQQEQARANIGASIIPRVDLTTKLYDDGLVPYRYGFYPVTAEDSAALEEARKSGMFYVSARVADTDCNPWRVGGIAGFTQYQDEDATELYCVTTFHEDWAFYLHLVRENYDGDFSWSVACLAGVYNGSLEGTNTGDDFPEPA